MLITLKEMFDMVLMTGLIGFIISGFLKIKPNAPLLDWENIKFAIYLAAPAVILHELGHKFVAMSFGYEATFHSPISIQHILNPFLIFTDFYAMLMVIAIIMRIYGAGFLFFIPAFVSIMGTPTTTQSMMMAFAGPAVNALLWVGSYYYLKQHVHLSRKKFILIYLTKQINMFLFIFNMLPLPGFDGYSVFSGLIHLFS